MRLRDEQGMMAMGVALLLIVVLSLFGGALWQYSMLELRRVERAEEDLQALFLARAGAEAVLGAWKKRLVQEGNQQTYAVPLGQLDTLYLYLDGENYAFSSDKPARYIGTVDVTVSEEAATEIGDRVIVIESTANVGLAKRTARLVTSPFLFGHHDGLGWYSETSGEILVPQGAVLEPVFVRRKAADQPIYLSPAVLRDNSGLTFMASHILFESPLRLINDLNTLRNSSSGDFYLVLAAETVFLHGLAVAHVPRWEADLFGLEIPVRLERNYGAIFTLPTPGSVEWGEKGSEIAAKVSGGPVDPNARYGQVYFGSETYVYKEYEWFLAWRGLLPSVDVRERKTVPFGVSGQAFYFKVNGDEGWPLDPKAMKRYLDANPGATSLRGFFDQAVSEGLLLPIKPEFQTRREEFESFRSFFWEQ